MIASKNKALPPLQSIKFGARDGINHLLQAAQGATTTPRTSDVDSLRGHTYFTVDVVTPDMRFTGIPIMIKGLAVELYLALSAELHGPDVKVIIQPCVSDAEDYKSAIRVAAKNKDLIISCRSADRPGYEYLARLGHYGEYDPGQSAPQNDTSASCGAQGGDQ